MSLSALTSRLLATTSNTSAATTDTSQNQKSTSTTATSDLAKGAALVQKSSTELMQDLISLSAQSKGAGGSEPLVYTAKQLLAQLRNNMTQSDPLLQSMGQTDANAAGTHNFAAGLTLSGATGSGGIAALISGALPDTAAGSKSQNAAVSKFLSNNPSLVDAYRQSLSAKGGFTTLS